MEVDRKHKDKKNIIFGISVRKVVRIYVSKKLWSCKYENKIKLEEDQKKTKEEMQ
jgi:hypothetical protein